MTVHDRQPLSTWLTIPEAADYIRVTRQTIYNLINEGRLPYFEIPGVRGKRIKREDLDKLLIPGQEKVDEEI